MLQCEIDERFYYLNDHLGSIRAIVDSSGTTVFAQDTYPYGDVYRNYSLGGYSDQKYDFTGKERDTETGLHYYGARYYDSDLGRWLQVDPLADKYPGWSPYNYCVNNPVRMVDPDGMAAIQSDELSSESGEGENANNENEKTKQVSKKTILSFYIDKIGEISNGIISAVKETSQNGNLIGLGVMAIGASVTLVAPPVGSAIFATGSTISNVSNATNITCLATEQLAGKSNEKELGIELASVASGLVAGYSGSKILQSIFKETSYGSKVISNSTGQFISQSTYNLSKGFVKMGEGWMSNIPLIVDSAKEKK